MTWRTFWRISSFAAAGLATSFVFLVFWGLGVWVIPLITILSSLIISLVLLSGVIALSFYGKFYFTGSIFIVLGVIIIFTIIYHRYHFKSTAALYSVIIPICRGINIPVWIFLLFIYSAVYCGW